MDVREASARSRTGRAAARRDSRLFLFSVFAESLLTGVWVVLAALPVVTLLPAFAAGCAHLRRHLDGERSTWRDFLSGLRELLERTSERLPGPEGNSTSPTPETDVTVIPLATPTPTATP